MRPSPWLRLTALGGAAATLLAVVSGSAELGAGHRVLAALALPPLAAVAAAAWISYRRLLAPAVAALPGMLEHDRKQAGWSVRRSPGLRRRRASHRSPLAAARS